MDINETQEHILRQLPDAKEVGNNHWKDRCPVPGHEDKDASFHVTRDNGALILKCFGGCTQDAIYKTLGVTKAEVAGHGGKGNKWVIKREGIFHNLDGTPRHKEIVYKVEGPKMYRWEGGKWVAKLKNQERIIYNAAAIVEAPPETIIFFVEGFKDADTAKRIGLTATAIMGGANGWKDYYPQYFTGKQVCVIPDMNDNTGAGYKLASQVEAALKGVADCVTGLLLPNPNKIKGYDLTNYIEDGGRAEDLLESARNLLDAASEYDEPTESTETTEPMELPKTTSESPPKTEPEVEPGRLIKIARAEPLSKFDEAETDYIWENRIAKGNFTLLCGPGGTGKGLLSLYIAATISKGLPWPDTDGERDPGDVLILSREDKLETTIMPRIRRMHANEDRIFWFQGVFLKNEAEGTEDKKIGIVLNEDLGAIRNLMTSYDNFQLLILDPVPSYTGRADNHRNAEIRQALEPLVEMAQELNFAILGIHHNNKRGSMDAILNVSGATAFVDLPRIVLKTDKDKRFDHPDITKGFLSIGKSNLGVTKRTLSYSIGPWQPNPKIPILEIDREVLNLDSNDVLDMMQPSADRAPKQTAAVEFLKNELQDGPKSVKELTRLGELQDLKYHHLNNASKKLKLNKSQDKFHGGWTWELS